MIRRHSALAATALCALAATPAPPSAAAEPSNAPGRNIGYYGAIPYDGTLEQALAASRKGSTIPLASFTTSASKDGNSYPDTIVGASPFASKLGATTIDVLVVPMVVTIGTTAFDPTATSSCIAGDLTPLAAFEASPILKQVTFNGKSAAGHASLVNGVNIGKSTYPDAMRRAEFWSLVGGSKYHTKFRTTFNAPFVISADTVKNTLGGGKTYTTSCDPIGVLPTVKFQSYVKSTILPSLTAASPTTFVLLLFKDIVTSPSSQLSCTAGCELGYHSASGTTMQTYGVGEYDTTLSFWNSAGVTDISILAHEVGEWMDDPLVNNATPAWGGIGQVSGCQANWEVGDPLTGTDFPAIKMSNGISYNPQELAFYSWFYNAENAASLGAGGKFSMNGTFGGPSKACPPGGTY
jgi:hypothetical protein